MSGRRQREEFIRAHKDGSGLPEGRFDLDGRKVRCVLCGRDGYGALSINPHATFPVKERGHRILLAFLGGGLARVEGPDTAPKPPEPMPWWMQFSPWQIDCLEDHPWPCSCGRRFRRYVDLWRHIGAERPAGWGRQGVHAPELVCEVAA